MIHKVLLTAVILLLPFMAEAASLQEKSATLVSQAGSQSVVAGEDGWLFLKEELEHLAAGKFWGEEAAKVTRTKKKEDADPLSAIIRYQQLLAAEGIELYLAPVPPKALVYPEKLAADLSLESTASDRQLYEQFYEQLRGQGVKVIDLLPAFVAQKEQNLYCRTDTHFSGNGLALLAQAVTEEMQKTDWYGGVAQQAFAKERQKITITGDLARMAGKNEMTEEFDLTFVKQADGQPVASDEASPLVLLGDSHTLVFQAGGDLHAKGAGLFDLLSADLGFAVDLLGVRGSGVTPARIKFFQRAKKDSAYLSGKKALIWCFTARDFTGTGGWKDIPVRP